MTLGIKSGGIVEILSGLRDDELVVQEGVASLRDEQAVESDRVRRPQSRGRKSPPKRQTRRFLIKSCPAFERPMEILRIPVLRIVGGRTGAASHPVGDFYAYDHADSRWLLAAACTEWHDGIQPGGRLHPAHASAGSCAIGAGIR